MEPGVSVMGSVLSIPSLEARHSGIYQCFARNDFQGRVGEDSRTWILEVRPPSKELQTYIIQIPWCSIKFGQVVIIPLR